MGYTLMAATFARGDIAEDLSIPPRLEELLRPYVHGAPRGPVWRVRTPDGGEAEIEISALGTGFSIKSSSGGGIADLVYHCAEATNLTILGVSLPSMLTNLEQLQHLPEGFPAPVLIESGHELERLIERDDDTYRSCRERVVR